VQVVITFFTADIHDCLLGGATIIAAMHNPTQFRLCDHQTQRIGLTTSLATRQRLIILADQNSRLDTVGDFLQHISQ
jgi:ABC-type protease/lipase transport system fused ATPase/permease subunit